MFLRTLGIALVLLLSACGGSGSPTAGAGSDTHGNPAGNNPPTVDGAARVVLPIELIGAPGLVESATLKLTGAPADAAYLWLKTHRLAWREDGEFAMKFNGAVRPGAKGSVRLNGGPWVPLANSTAALSCEKHEAEFGCLNGTYMTVRVRLQMAALGQPGLKPGDNKLDFRFDATDGISSGWRVLGIDVRNTAGASLIADNFVWDDPDSWAPPLNTAADIAAGKSLWSNAPLTDLGFDNSRHAIHGKCAHCHFQDGYDLKYFNYSNKAIVARSVFHGLSETQGKQIAAYIRSLDLKLPAGVKVSQAGRPWNPPYQPGPGLDAKPVELWAAGAGLDAVLETDAQMGAYLLPGGKYDPALLGASGFLNPREMPQALQYPDWNTWLPTMAIADMVSDPSKAVPFAGDTPPATKDQNPLDKLKVATQWLDQFRWTEMEHPGDPALGDFHLRWGLFLVEVWGTSRWWDRGPGFPGEVWPDRPAGFPADSTPLSTARHSLARVAWYNLRMFELMQQYKLQAMTDRAGIAFDYATGKNARGIPKGFRSWSMPFRTLFETAPHFVRPDDAAHSITFDFTKPGQYLSTAWYSLEQIVNGGWRSGANGIDWNYHPFHVAGMHSSGTQFYTDGPIHLWRTAWSVLWMYQSIPPEAVPADVFQFSQRQLGQGLDIPFENEAEAAGVITPAQRKQLQEAQALAFLGVAERIRPDQWLRRTVDDDAHRTAANFETSNYAPDYDPNWSYDLPERGYQADAYYLRIKLLKDRKLLTNATLTRLVNWGKGVWPKGNWAVLMP